MVIIFGAHWRYRDFFELFQRPWVIYNVIMYIFSYVPNRRSMGWSAFSWCYYRLLKPASRREVLPCENMGVCYCFVMHQSHDCILIYSEPLASLARQSHDQEVVNWHSWYNTWDLLLRQHREPTKVVSFDTPKGCWICRFWCDHYCIFHVTLQWSRSRHVSQPIFEVSLLAQNFIDSSEILYIVTYIYLGAPSTGTSNFIFLIFRFFTHN